MVLAFRLYGNFHWPPHPDIAKLSTATKSGTVEIHYREKEEAGVFRPLLRWIPGEAFPPPEIVEPFHESIFDFTVEEAVAWFETNADTDCAIWIDAGKYTKKTDWVSFRGAFLLDQYTAPHPVANRELDLRWPLVRSCEYVTGRTSFSALSVGHYGGPRYSLNLNLPLPARRSTLAFKKHLNPSAFPFGAVYEPRDGAFGEILEFTTLVGGWIAGDTAGTSPKGSPLPSFVFDQNKFPSHARLGTFGFAARGKPSQGGFAIYDGKQKEAGDDDEVVAEQFWPSNSRPVTEDILKQHGFSVDPKSAEWPLLKAGASTADLSLRFSRRGSDARQPSVIYRLAISAGKTNPPKSDDLKKGTAGLSLRLQRETGGSIDAAETLYVDCKLTWNIPDKEIWNAGNRRWSPKVDVSFHWKTGVDKQNLCDGPLSSTNLDFGLMRHAAHSFREAREALKSVEAGQPRSVLPDLRIDGKQAVRFALCGPSFDARYASANGLLLWGKSAATGDPSTPFIRPRLRLTLAHLSDLIPNSDDVSGIGDNRLTLIAAGQTFFNGHSPPEIKLVLSRDDGWSDAQEDKVADGEPFFASYVVEAVRPATTWSGRLSSLKFSASAEPIAPKPTEEPKPPEELTATYLRAGGPGTRQGMGTGAAPINLGDGRIAASIHLVLPVSDVEPIGVDVSRMDRSSRSAPLLIPHDEHKEAASGARYWLSMKESIAPTQDRLIEADIYESASEAGEQSYVVVSQEPFSVLRYSHRPLSDRGDAGSASVAYYSGDDRIWQYRKVADHYHYVLPPQSVGESADKPRRLEIHDLGGLDTTDPSDALRPYVRELDDAGNDITGSGLKRRAVEFKLTPSTEFWIRPSDVERGYFMPESTSYEIFRQRGEYGLGAALAFLRGEFLYGLSVGIDVSKENSISRLARVAEIEALTGRMTGPARDADAGQDLSARWNALTRAVARRPERLEIWARDPDSAIDFTPARFVEGVTYALRGTALHRPPLEKLEKAENHELWPKVGRLKPKTADPDDVSRLDRSKPRTHPQGLSGGALWPVESVNLFNELLERPESTGGTIEAIALSPVGGDATQKAAFLGGIVTIISETRNGHVERQKVEVLGRIGAFWHRAKHVVVYERTVNASAQFAPKFKEDEQHTRSRRPILRKVREYVELLEHERAYPDFAEAVPRCTGFLERVRFNARIINVDSAWSSEVGDYGWKIPLWNMLSARERPQVYPMPDIAFVSTAEGDGDNPVVSQECLDTDNLFFFSDFKADTSNTNAWLSRVDIDYANMPIAREIAACADAKSAAPSNGRRRAVSRILPGVRRFTWRLAPAARKTAINAGRAGKPVYVGLDSVSFMRAAHAGQKTLRPDLLDVAGNAGILNAEKEKLKKIEALAYWRADGTGTELPAAADYSASIGQLIEKIKAADKTGVEEALKILDDRWTSAGLVQKIKDELPKSVGDGAAALGKLKLLDQALDGGEKLCAKLKSDAAGMIRRKEMLLATALSDWVSDIQNNFPVLATDDGPITTKTAAIEELTRRITVQLRPLFAEASQDVGDAGQGAEKAKSILAAIETEIEAIFARARQRLEQFSAGYDRDKPWSDERRKAFRSGLQASIGNIADDIASATDEARQRFAVELSGVSQAIGGHLAKSLTQLAKLAQSTLQGAGTVEESVDRLLATLMATIDILSPEAGAGKLDAAMAAINDVDGKIKAEPGISPKLRDDAADALNTLLAAATRAKALCADARILLLKAGELTEETFGSLAETIAGLTANASSLVEALADKAGGIATLAQAFLDEGFDAIAAEFAVVSPDIDKDVDRLSQWLDGKLLAITEPVDFLVASTVERLQSAGNPLVQHLHDALAATGSMIADVQDGFKAVQDALAPEQLLETVVHEKAIKPALALLLSPIDEDLSKTADVLPAIHDRLTELSTTTVTIIRTISADTLGTLEQVTAACKTMFEGVDDVRGYLHGVATNFGNYVSSELETIQAQYAPLIANITRSLDNLEAEAQSLIAAVRAFDCSVRSLQNDLSRSVETARMYGDRVFDAASRLTDGGVMAMPSNVLKLYSAVSSAPELAALKADIDRIRSGFDELSDIIETTEAGALFNRLGDELKALGLTLPFDKIGDRLIPADLSNFDIGKVFGNFGGINLDSLFKGYKIPAGVRDVVRVTHDFDKAQARAWVQVDIDAPMPGRRSLFSLGVFQVDFVDMQLTGQVRLEASKDQDRVTQSGFGRIGTTIDVIAAGQSMVKFEKFGLNFTREKGLDVEFDPKNIRLNPAFKFIQDFLSTLFPDEAGGLKIVKQDNIPVGVEHDFVIPPMTLNFGTSGVSNISIENHFKLLAFPDFMIANRFNLSTVERPFIFSIFVIGGTGYIQIDAEYRPFDSQLMVSVEAGAGGSAALAFAVGPFVGQVFITLSGVMTYRKMIGKPGGGLSLAVVVVIAGQVEVCGIVSVGITLMLRLSYRDNGQVDGQGSLAVTIRISRFFQISAHANVNYKLRGGKSETSVSSGVSGEITDDKLKDKIGKAEQAVKQLQKASN